MRVFGHVVKSWCSTQKRISLSSAEAELHAANEGAAEGLGIVDIARDFGDELSLILRSVTHRAAQCARSCGCTSIELQRALTASRLRDRSRSATLSLSGRSAFQFGRPLAPTGTCTSISSRATFQGA